jgi:hypothetical protein
MAFTRLTREIPITAAGGTFTIDVDSPEVEYTITGVATMAGNVTISPTSSGVIPNNTKVIINYLATLDTTITTFNVFGVFLNGPQTLRDQHIICDYVNSAWTVQILSNFANPDIVGTSNIVNGAVTNSKLATDSVSTIKILDLAVTTNKIDNLAVTTAKLDTNAVTTAKILDLNVTTSKLNTDAVTTVKILDLNVTTAKIDNLAVTDAKLAANSVITSKILNSNVTDAKLAAMTASSIKYGNALGAPGNLALALDKIPVGNGTTVTVVDKNDLLNGVGTYTQICFDVSFETAEINAVKKIYLPFPCLIYKAIVSVTTLIEATDNATITIEDAAAAATCFSSTIIAGATVPSSTTTTISYSYLALSAENSILNVTTTKVTPGGRAFVTLLLQKT